MQRSPVVYAQPRLRSLLLHRAPDNEVGVITFGPPLPRYRHEEASLKDRLSVLSPHLVIHLNRNRNDVSPDITLVATPHTPL